MRVRRRRRSRSYRRRRGSGSRRVSRVRRTTPIHRFWPLLYTVAWLLSLSLSLPSRWSSFYRREREREKKRNHSHPLAFPVRYKVEERYRGCGWNLHSILHTTRMSKEQAWGPATPDGAILINSYISLSLSTSLFLTILLALANFWPRPSSPPNSYVQPKHVSRKASTRYHPHIPIGSDRLLLDAPQQPSIITKSLLAVSIQRSYRYIYSTVSAARYVHNIVHKYMCDTENAIHSRSTGLISALTYSTHSHQGPSSTFRF